MPAKSEEQRRFFGLAYAIRKGKLSRNKVSKNILDVVDGDMSTKSIKDYASTKHSDIKENDGGMGNPTFPKPKKFNEELRPTAVAGMGDIGFPDNPGATTTFSSQKTGSGDIPVLLKKKKRIIEYFNDFISSRAYHSQMTNIAPYGEFIDKEENGDEDEKFRIKYSSIETNERLQMIINKKHKNEDDWNSEFKAYDIDVLKHDGYVYDRRAKGIIELDNKDIIEYDYENDKGTLKVNGTSIDNMGNFFDIPADYADYRNL